MRRILALQFGNVYQRRAPGYVLQSRLYASPFHVWERELEERASVGVDDPVEEGYLRGREANTLHVGLGAGTYRITLILRDPAAGHGPFDLTVGGTPVLRGLTVTAGAAIRVTGEAHVHDTLRLVFNPAPGADFIVNGLIIEGPEDAVLRGLFATAPSVEVPPRAALAPASDDETRRALARVCGWLMAHRAPDGWLGDTDRNWYTVSMPVRALLAAHHLLGEPAWRDAAFEVMDRFVDEQMPSGAFCSTWRGKATADLDPQVVDRIAIHARQPMSDIGSVVAALAVASVYADAGRQARYVGSVRRFCDGWAIRYQEPDGGFTDGPWGKDWLTTVYSCATAIEASVFALAAVVTGVESYRGVARRAIDFLIRDWREDGRMVGRAPHWLVHGGRPFVMEPLHFGDQWYFDDGFITVARADPDTRASIDRALAWRVFGSSGLLAALGDGAWWPIQDIWNNAKSIGMAQTLLYARCLGRETDTLERALAGIRSFLCTPAYAARVGVMADDAERPVARHGYQTWTGMDRQSAGFAGMTLAEMLEPGVLYLVSR